MRNYLWPALAGLFLAAATAAVAGQQELAGFSRDEALGYSQAAIGNTVSGISLLRTDGTPVPIESFRGRPLVVSLIFTSCHHICPATTAHLEEVVGKARKVLGQDSFQVVTVGFDTVNDTPGRMAQFRHSNGVEDPRWEFLAGDEANMASLVRQLGFIYAASPRGFDHLIQTSVLDADGRLYRQVYGITFPTPQLVEPLKALVFGEAEAPSSLSYLENRIRLFCTVYDPATDTYHIDVSVFIGTFVGVIVSLVFGWVLVKEWRRSLGAGR